MQSHSAAVCRKSLPKASPSNSEAWCRQSNGKSNLHGKLSIQDLLWSCVLSSAFGDKLNGEKHVVQKNHSLHKSHFCGLDGRLLCSLERGSYPQNSTVATQLNGPLRSRALCAEMSDLSVPSIYEISSTISLFILMYSEYPPAWLFVPWSFKAPQQFGFFISSDTLNYHLVIIFFSPIFPRFLLQLSTSALKILILPAAVLEVTLSETAMSS